MSVGKKSAVTVYVTTFVGTVPDPLYCTFATAPGTELAVMLTVAACGEPLNVAGELVTESVAVGVALLTVCPPANELLLGPNPCRANNSPRRCAANRER